MLLLGLMSDYFRRRWWASDPLAALLLGVLLGPLGLGWITPRDWGVFSNDILEQVTRLTIAIGLMGIALRIPKGAVRRQWRSLLVLLGLVMPFMWFTSSLLIHLIVGLPWWQALMIGAAVTPTDPIVSTSIVSGKVAETNLPDRLRCLLSVESGINDGLAYPFMLSGVLILEKTLPRLTAPTEGNVLGYWLMHIVLIEVGGAIMFGAVAGAIAGKLLQWAERKKFIEKTSFLVYSLALSVTLLGIAKLLGTDSILAVFVAGVVYGNIISGQERSQEENVQEAIDRFFTLPVFILLGILLPWSDWVELGWRAVAIAIATLLLRRLPILLLLKSQIPTIKNWQEAAFVGWFGPMGVAAIFYATLGLRRTNIEAIWIIVSLIVTASIVAHSLSATPLTQLYGDRFAQHHGSHPKPPS